LLVFCLNELAAVADLQQAGAAIEGSGAEERT
jgi:hypothetical protein